MPDIDPKRQAIAYIFDGWLAAYEHGEPIKFMPAREYAADAVKDCRDAVLAILDGAKRHTISGSDAAEDDDI